MPVVILTLYALIALFPIVMIIMNSFKARKAIFGAPFAFPTSETFSLIGYETVTERSTFHLYFLNSAIVTFVALSSPCSSAPWQPSPWQSMTSPATP